MLYFMTCTMYKKTNRRPTKKEDAREVLGGKLFFNLTDIELSMMLDKSLFGFFDSCFSVNHVLGKHEYFSRFLKGVTSTVIY